MPALTHRFLDLARMDALRHVRLRPRGVAEGALAGPHRSRHRGSGVEFADYREYSEGDDIRLVDWKVFARTDRHYVRLYDAERNLLSYLVVDKSGSMEFTGVAQTTDSKLVHASRLAAALAYLVVREGDEVGLSLAGDALHDHVPASGSWRHLSRVLDALGTAQPAGRTNLGQCLEDVYRRIRRRGVLIVLSDFLDASPAFWQQIDLYRRSHFDVMLFHIAHPEELELPAVAAARFIGTEDEPGQFTTEPDQVRQLYRERIRAHINGVEANARARGCDWYLARTDEDPYVFLQHGFLLRDRDKGAPR